MHAGYNKHLIYFHFSNSIFFSFARCASYIIQEWGALFYKETEKTGVILYSKSPKEHLNNKLVLHEKDPPLDKF